MTRSSLLVVSITLTRLRVVVVLPNVTRFYPCFPEGKGRGYPFKSRERLPERPIMVHHPHNLTYAAFLCVLPNLASLYVGATANPSRGRHALYKSTRNTLIM